MQLRIKEVLKSKAVTTASLAESVGITRANMSNIVNDKTMPSLQTLEKIAAALNVPILELFEQPKSDVITCPNCGTRLKVTKE